MRKLFITILLATSIYTIPMIYVNLVNASTIQVKPNPSYAKWGILAIEKAAKKYPNAQVTDYLHIGRKVGNQSTTEKFKLILKEGKKEFGLFVTIEFDSKTEEVIQLNFEETTP
ncbi:DUF3889 domain-containing protein [Solibacillus sp. FSL H8-0538]|uniref:DUF3889 domain-containing protein n=1 Tax=Solibacillus sp. FSL H8-0538 TaxID=2921400 RepID=UPI004046935C